MDKSVAEILAGVDLFAEDQREHLLDALAAARRDCPVLHTDSDGGYYVVSRYADVRTVCEQPELFSSVQPGLRGVPVRLIPVDVDPPRHRLYRTRPSRGGSRPNSTSSSFGAPRSSPVPAAGIRRSNAFG